MQNKYSSNSKKPTVNVDAIKKGIALSQYQKSTQNPYSNQEVIKLNNDFSTSVRQEKRVFEMPLENKVQLKREFTSPYIQRTNKFYPDSNSGIKACADRANQTISHTSNPVFHVRTVKTSTNTSNPPFTLCIIIRKGYLSNLTS